MKTHQYIQKIAARLMLIFALSVAASSCKKQDDWLDVKNNKKLVTPATLKDMQAILDDSQTMNSYGSVSGLIGTDNITLTDANLNSLDQVSRNMYLWASDLLQNGSSADWTFCYQRIEYANIVLDALNASNNSGAVADNIRGSALFYRAKAFYELAQLFCKPYSKTAATDPGIPLKLTSEVDEQPSRGTVAQTYQQILSDLKLAVPLLPETPLYRTRPSSVAANGMIAKVSLTIANYDDALKYANLPLQKYGTLLDYNTLTASVNNPFPAFSASHPEIIFYEMTLGSNVVWSSSSVKCRVDPALYASYESADLRKGLFYTADGTTGTYRFKGSYSAQTYNFDGIATNELYLIRAEAYARKGDLINGLADLNLLLKNRYSKAGFTAINLPDPQSLLQRILMERRKEMPFTGNIRWEDLRRLNQESGWATTLTRTANGQTYQLPPNDNRYVFPFPALEISINSFTQNPR